MQMKKLGVGFIGSDVHVGGYIKAFSSIEAVELIGVGDEREETAEALCRQGEMRYFTTDYQRLLADDDIQIIMVCSPDCFHAEHAIAALRAGKHVLCEKPMTTTLADCRKLVQTVDETGMTFMVSQFMRFEPIYKKIKQIYDAGQIGRAFFVEGSYIHDMRSLYDPTTWRSDPKTAQDILIGGGCHPFDLLRWAVGSDVAEVHAYANGYATPNFPLDDCYIFTFQFENGCVGKVLATSGCRGHGMGEGFLSIYGTEGTIWKNHIHHSDGRREEIIAERGNASGDTVSHFVECVVNGTQPSIDVREGAKTVSALAAGVESVAAGKPIRVVNEFG
jgi:UDP-N-acetylglucosamine 3-dehydrogenase